MTVDAIGRALGIYRRTAASRSAIVLLIANAIPLAGVLFLDWSLWTILVVYWLENGIVGFWNVPKIAFARGPVISQLPGMPDAPAGPVEALGGLGIPIRLGPLGRLPGAVLAVFFSFHYGIFWVVHGVFVLMLPSVAAGFGESGIGPGALFPSSDPGGGAFGEILWPYVALAAVALFISHGASFVLNYLGRGEYRTSSPASQMMAPYARVIVLHLTILLGGVAIAAIGAPIGALLVMVALKTLFDLGLHLREHRPA